VPDLGPAVLMDQLTVMVHDVSVVGCLSAGAVRVRLAQLRSRLA
jgi:hypothetical protein